MNKQELEERQQRLAQLQRMRATAIAEAFMYDDKIKALLGGTPTMFDLLVAQDENKQVEVKAPTHEEPFLATTFDWADFARTDVPALIASKGLPPPLKTIQEPNIPDDKGQPMTLTFVGLGENGIVSSHVTSVGLEVRYIRAGEASPDEAVQPISTKLQARFYVRFKGGGLYRYWAVEVFYWYALCSIMAQTCNGERHAQTMTVGATTVGEFVERVLKAKHDAGQISCEKLDGDKWVPALKPSEVTAQRSANKSKRKGQEVAVEVIRDIARESRNPDEKPHPEAPDAALSAQNLERISYGEVPPQAQTPADKGQQEHATGSIPPTDVGDEAQF
jgi:hypothetical protein